MVCPENAPVGTPELDVDAAIASFLADPKQKTLELPRLSTGQRKQARKVADMHPELVCESFGFGQDRRLHLFKASAGDAHPGAATGADARLQENKKDEPLSPNIAPVSIKNTFIDDWADSGIASPEPVVARSMPPSLPKNALQRCVELGVEIEEEQTSRSSTSASAPSQPCCTPGGSMLPTLPAQPQELQMRNTFIHFETSTADERAIQSMPHGMFGKCLLTEAALARESEAVGSITSLPSAVPEIPAEVAVQSTLEVGAEIVIEGLSKCPAFNGLRGVVQSFDEEQGRYTVLLSTPSTGRQWAKIKGDNLRPAVPPPPSEPPVLFGSFA